MANEVIDLNKLENIADATKKMAVDLSEELHSLVDAGKACAQALDDDEISKKMMSDLVEAISKLSILIDMAKNIYDATVFEIEEIKRLGRK